MTDPSPILAILAILTAALPIATAAAIHDHHHRSFDRQHTRKGR